MYILFFQYTKCTHTHFAIHFGVHDDELGAQLADAPALQDGHQAPQVLQVQRVAGPPRLRVVLCTLHGAVQPLVAGSGVADKVSDVVGVRDRRLKRGMGRETHIKS